MRRLPERSGIVGLACGVRIDNGPWHHYREWHVARLFGPFALTDDGSYYRVSHAPTGSLVIRTYSKRIAFRVLRKLLELGVDWIFTDMAEVPAETKAAVRRIVEEVEGVEDYPSL